MKIVQSSQLILVALFLLAISPGRAVVGPVYHEPPPDPPPVATAPAPPPAPEYDSVDRIKGIGPFKFGAKLSDFPPESLQPVDPRAHGILLKVSPYGANYLVTDVKDLSWGGIPLAGLIVTFNDGVLIDLQVALKARKIDFYIADRAFTEKYGPSDVKTFPVSTWTGDHIQVTYISVGTNLADPDSINKPAEAKIDLLDLARWTKVEDAKRAKLEQALEKTYEASANKVKASL